MQLKKCLFLLALTAGTAEAALRNSADVNHRRLPPKAGAPNNDAAKANAQAKADAAAAEKAQAEAAAAAAAEAAAKAEQEAAAKKAAEEAAAAKAAAEARAAEQAAAAEAAAKAAAAQAEADRIAAEQAAAAAAAAHQAQQEAAAREAAAKAEADRIAAEQAAAAEAAAKAAAEAAAKKAQEEAAAEAAAAAAAAAAEAEKQNASNNAKKGAAGKTADAAVANNEYYDLFKGLENTCSVYVGDGPNTSNKRYSCCETTWITEAATEAYGACETSSCVVNFGMKNLNCFNYGSPQHPSDGSKPRGGAGGSNNCPYAADDHAICDTSYYNGVNGEGKWCRKVNGINHCLGRVKCNTVGVTIPTGNNKGHSDGTADYETGKANTGCANSSFQEGELCFYNGNSENWKVCGSTPEAQTDEEELANSPLVIEEVTPTPSEPLSTGAYGDPHVRTWAGEHYSYHGACDLVLVQNPKFADGLGLDIHIRNVPLRHMSYIDAAVLRIGGETLEVRGGDSSNEYWINGVLGEPALEDGELPETIGGFPVHFSWLSKGRRKFVVDLGNGESVLLKTYKYFVHASIKAETVENFGSSVGLMGTYPDGLKVGRDGVTEIEDYDEFGQEWQVLANEPMLFHSVEGPQAPAKCAMPVLSTQRRLAESSVTLDDAEIACAHVAEEDRDNCIFDVLATEDKDMAGAY